MKVLVVEDEPDTQELVVTILRERGASVEAVSSTREALDALARGRPDVLLSDIGLPGEDGLALIRAVRDMPEGAGLPAAALTAYAREQDRRQALGAGFQAHVAKPIRPSDLVQIVAGLVAARPAAGPERARRAYGRFGNRGRSHGSPRHPPACDPVSPIRR